MKKSLLVLFIFPLLCSCNHPKAKMTTLTVKSDTLSQVNPHLTRSDTRVIQTEKLVFYIPEYDDIELTLGAIFNIDYSRQINMFIPAMYSDAYPEYIDVATERGIFGRYVYEGEHTGMLNASHNGAFVYYKKQYKFVKDGYLSELDSAVIYDGTGFSQKLIVYAQRSMVEDFGEKIENHRVLAELGHCIAVVDNKEIMKQQEFVNALLNAGVINAISLITAYAESGAANFRYNGKKIELYSPRIKFCNNWITFYSNRE